MRETAAAEPRPYHHGDLRRALIDAARRLLESEGPNALSLRAVAREALCDAESDAARGAGDDSEAAGERT